MGVSIGPKIGVQGADQFRYEFKEMATVARQLKAEMDALTASFKENDSETNKNGKTREALTKRIEQQEKVIEKAKQGVELATKAQENAVAANERAKAKLDDLIKKREDAKKSLETATAAQEKAQERVNSLNDASERLTAKLAQLKLEGKENTDTFKDLEHSVKYVDKQFDEAAKTLIKANKAQADADSKVKSLNASVKSQEDKVEATERSITKANITISEYKTKVAEATEEQNNLNAALEKTPDSLESFGEDLIKKGEAISQVGEAISKVLAPFSALTVFSLKGASSFTDALAKISTIADTSVVSLEEFGDGIKQIASDTGFATDDIAAATYQALSAAVSTEEALKFTAGAADLARAGFLDMFGSVDVLTTILNAYHKSVDDVGHISDVLVKVQDKGKQYLFVFNAKNRYTPFTLATA